MSVAKSKIWKGVAAGAIGGLAGSWVMEEFQYAWINGAEVRVASLVLVL
jgi:hypothetical protein